VENQGATEREERASRKGREERSEEKRKKKIKEKGFSHTHTHLEVLTIENQKREGITERVVFLQTTHSLPISLDLKREKKQRGKRVKDLILGK
jgi:hypothetical protein